MKILISRQLFDLTFLLLIESKLFRLALSFFQYYHLRIKQLLGFKAEIINNIDELINNLKNNINGSERIFHPEIQKELSNLLRVCVQIKSLIYTEKYNQSQSQTNNKISSIIPNLHIAFCSFDKNITLATRVRRDIEMSLCEIKNPKTSFFSKFRHHLAGISTPAKVLTGLFMALPIHLCAPFILWFFLSNAKVHIQPIFQESLISKNLIGNPNPSDFKFTNNSVKNQLSEQELDEFLVLLLLSAIAGSTGSVVSIISRLNEYQTEVNEEPLFPVFVGAFKPMIGAFMGMFLFAFLNSQLLPILIPKEPANKWFAVISLTFLIGFSERFANDLISQAEQKVSSSSQKKEVQ